MRPESAPGYDPTTDTWASVAYGFEFIRTRVLAGGKGWRDFAPDGTKDGPRLDVRNVGDGLVLLQGLRDNISPLVFFDPQHRSNLDHQKYGNEGVNRGQRRAALPQQSPTEIAEIGEEIRRVLKPSGYCARWANTFEVLEHLYGVEGLQPVAMVTWDNGAPGMGGRVRTCGAHLVLLQKPPVGVRAKRLTVAWGTKPMIRAVHHETIRFPRAAHPHKKPVGLTAEIILAITEPGDLVLDPCAGSFTTLSAALGCGRHCLATDLVASFEKTPGAVNVTPRPTPTTPEAKRPVSTRNGAGHHDEGGNP